MKLEIGEYWHNEKHNEEIRIVGSEKVNDKLESGSTYLPENGDEFIEVKYCLYGVTTNGWIDRTIRLRHLVELYERGRLPR